MGVISRQKTKHLGKRDNKWLTKSGQVTSVEYSITDGHCISPPGNFMNGHNLEEDP